MSKMYGIAVKISLNKFASNENYLDKLFEISSRNSLRWDSIMPRISKESMYPPDARVAFNK